MVFSWSLSPSEADSVEPIIVTAENAMADGDITTLPDFMVLASRLGIKGPRTLQAFNLDSCYYERIAEGGQFQVFKHTEFGYDRRGGSAIVKRICPKLYKDKTPKSLRDLRLEVQVLAQDIVRKHPNIIDLIAWGYDYPHPVTEKLKAYDHERYPPNTPIPVLFVQEALCSLDSFFGTNDFETAEISSWDIRCHLLIGISAGLECLHRLGVFHNDLKPGNILIFRQDNHLAPFTSKLTDFGMSVTEAKSFREYGRTQGWRPPEARDYNIREHGEFSHEALFKCESYAYGLVAVYTISHGPDSVPCIPECHWEREKIVRELITNQPGFSIEDKNEATAVYLAVEQNFLRDSPRERERVSPGVLGLRDSIYEDCKIALSEIGSQASRKAAGRNQAPSALGLSRNHGGAIIRDLELGDVENYPGELLFEMAVAKGSDFNSIYGIDYSGVLELVRRSVMAKVPSLAGAGVVARMFSAFASTTRPPPPMDPEDFIVALYSAVASGSISARTVLRKMAPQRLDQAMKEFRITGGYNIERHLLSQRDCDMVVLALRERDDAATVRTLLSQPGMRGTQNTDLHIAALLGKHQLIQEIVSTTGIDINSMNAAGETPLYKACLAGQYESVRSLIKNGANPCIRVSPLEVSCLHWLFAFQSADMENAASLLISNGLETQARVLPAGNSGAYEWTGSVHFPFHWPPGTPLHWAAHAESPDAVDILLRLGAAVDQPDLVDTVHAQTALSMAMYRGNTMMVSHLLNKGADASRIDGKGNSQLHMVVGNDTLGRTLFPLAKHFMQWCYHGTFEDALISRRFCIAAIVKAGVDIDCERPIGRSSSKNTPLLDAVHRNDAAGVIALLEAGANANIVEEYSQRLPLHIWTANTPQSSAYPDAYLRALTALLDHSTNPEQRDMYGQSVIHAAMIGSDAIKSSDVEIWKQKLHLLLRYCPDLGVDDRDEDGRTLLVHITNYDSRHGWNVLPIIKILQYDFHADIRTKDNDGCDFLWHVSRKSGLGDGKCLHAMQQYLDQVPEDERMSVLKASMHTRTKRTALMNLANNAYTECVMYLLGHGADPNITDHDGETALGLSITTGNRQRLGLLGRCSIFLKRMPTQDDEEILPELFYKGESTNESSAWANEDFQSYFACPKVRDALIAAGGKTGKQLGTTEYAPDVKISEEMNLEELGWLDSFKREEQPFHDMWKISYDFDDN
ncbi:ankyrin repeat domain containing protein [Stemphylium lycopersici]|uniref:Ankyrin repeat domain containing protein n=1 Tax=Stemphylium lycopersici TaxID=183478 RepID=A0A364MRX2_STELY|nr:ankyrin repeat domain containing protein [Stemphylium lycopersici]RAR01391.1 ankyrin repeat domain containing protein [Stemphylium lycopersici]